MNNEAEIIGKALNKYTNDCINTNFLKDEKVSTIHFLKIVYTVLQVINEINGDVDEIDKMRDCCNE